MKNWGWLILVGIVIVAGGYMATGSLPASDIVRQFANAIATAEGFFVSGSRAQRNNNPGNIEDGNGNFVNFSTLNDGWNRLYSIVEGMFSGSSAYYNPSMTISQIGWIYADGVHDPTGATNWANNVASYLGVTTDTTLNQLGA